MVSDVGNAGNDISAKIRSEREEIVVKTNSSYKITCSFLKIIIMNEIIIYII